MNEPNELAQFYNIVKSGRAGALEQKPQPTRGPIGAIATWWDNWQTERAFAHIGRRLVKSVETSVEAAEQGSVVSAAFDAFGLYSDGMGESKDPTGISFSLLRQMVHNCEPLSIIIETWVRYAGAFCDTPDKRSGVVKRPGFEIRLSDKDAVPSAEDKENFKLITQFFLETGFCEPPDEEKPVGWQPGLQAFCAQIIRDTLTMDGAAIRRWKGKDGRYPIVTFAADDAARIRFPNDPYIGLKDGVRQFANWDSRNESANKYAGHIKLLKVDSPGKGGRTIETFTKEQMAYIVRNPRTDMDGNGYGYSETERCTNSVTYWCNSMFSNGSRFNMDTLPRGVLLLLGQLDETQVSSFKARWKQIMEGGANRRWKTPILRGNANGGGAVQWVPIDPSQRDMEYHNFMFLLAIIMHAIFGISPDETGMQAVSPFKPPLSEASPETKIQNANDKGFEPLLRWFRGILNREILWKMYPSRRYVLEFLGVGTGDEMADITLRGTILGFGLSTPRRQLAEMDEPVPEHDEDNPAVDMLGTYAANEALLMQMQQSHLAIQQQKMAMQQQQEAHSQQMAMQQMQATQPQGPPGAPGQPPRQGQPPGQQPGAAGSVGGAPPPGFGQPQPGEADDETTGSPMMKALFNPWDELYNELPPRARNGTHARKRRNWNGSLTLLDDRKER